MQLALWAISNDMGNGMREREREREREYALGAWIQGVPLLRARGPPIAMPWTVLTVI